MLHIMCTGTNGNTVTRSVEITIPTTGTSTQHGTTYHRTEEAVTTDLDDTTSEPINTDDITTLYIKNDTTSEPINTDDIATPYIKNDTTSEPINTDDIATPYIKNDTTSEPINTDDIGTPYITHGTTLKVIIWNEIVTPSLTNNTVSVTYVLCIIFGVLIFIAISFIAMIVTLLIIIRKRYSNLQNAGDEQNIEISDPACDRHKDDTPIISKSESEPINEQIYKNLPDIIIEKEENICSEF